MVCGNPLKSRFLSGSFSFIKFLYFYTSQLLIKISIMARVLLSGLVSDIRGKLNGSVFKQGNAGLTLQNKPASRRLAGRNGRNPQVGGSLKIFSATTAMANVRNTWNTMSIAQRTQWSALSLSSPTPQKNNSALFLNGLQTFLKANVDRVMTGQTVLKTPTVGLLPPAPLEVILVGDILNYTIQIDRIRDADEWIYIRMSAPVADTLNVPGSRLRLMRIEIAVGQDAVTFKNEYLEAFGLLPVVGQKLFVSVVAQNMLSGARLVVRPSRIEMV